MGFSFSGRKGPRFSHFCIAVRIAGLAKKTLANLQLWENAGGRPGAGQFKPLFFEHLFSPFSIKVAAYLLMVGISGVARTLDFEFQIEFQHVECL